MALASVAEQYLPPDELIVTVDHEGVGAAQNRNRAMYLSKADWIAFLDDDDTLYPWHLQQLIEAALLHEADLVYSGWDGINTDLFRIEVDGELVNPMSLPWGPKLESELRSCKPFIPVTFLVRGDFIRSTGGFVGKPDQPLIDQNDDYGAQIRLLNAGATFYRHPEVTWSWHGHPGHTSGRPWRLLTEPSGSFRGYEQ